MLSELVATSGTAQWLHDGVSRPKELVVFSARPWHGAFDVSFSSWETHPCEDWCFSCDIKEKLDALGHGVFYLNGYQAIVDTDLFEGGWCDRANNMDQQAAKRKELVEKGVWEPSEIVNKWVEMKNQGRRPYDQLVIHRLNDEETIEAFVGQWEKEGGFGGPRPGCTGIGRLTNKASPFTFSHTLCGAYVLDVEVLSHLPCLYGEKFGKFGALHIVEVVTRLKK